MAEMFDDSIMPIGTFKGQALINVPAWHLLWLLDQKWTKEQYPDLYDYIFASKSVLEKEKVAAQNRDRGKP
jgi:uncharacterized protein (DUF3820 family)